MKGVVLLNKYIWKNKNFATKFITRGDRYFIVFEGLLLRKSKIEEDLRCLSSKF